jgi:HK97 family phage major capsid protein
MARDTFENWIPDELGATPIEAFRQTSVVNAVARHEPMASDTKRIPRDGGFTMGAVAKGAAVPESTSTNDTVELLATKFSGIARIAEEDLVDTTLRMGIIALKERAAATDAAKLLDNACLGVNAARNGGTIPFTSLYYALTQNDTAAGYTANANLIATGGAVTYDDLVATVGSIEASEWADEGNLAWVMHPAFKGYLRGLVDGAQRPLINSSNDSLATGFRPTLLGYPIYFSRGAKKTTVADSTPAAGDRPLAFFGDTKQLIVGDPSLPGMPTGGIQYALQSSANGVGFETHETLMRATMRKAFTVGHISTWAVIEKS